MNYPLSHPIRYHFSKFEPINFKLEKEDDSWDVLCTEYHEEINEVISSHIIELNKWKNIKTLEALGLENLNKLSKLINEAKNNLENKKMSKEIIIDNTNVLNCPNFQENYGEYWQGCWEYNDICYKFNGSYCADNPNCEYKIANKKDGV